jgi:predicted amidophosphoribosyltransferase
MRLKSGDPAWLPVYARLVREQTIQHRMLSSLFAADSILVPVPGSAPSTRGMWAALRLASALHGVGLGGSVWTGIERRFPVRKSATALNTARPIVQQHYESFAVAALESAPGKLPTRLIIVDDVITKGRTLLAAAIRLHEAFPNADIRAFALVRTMGFVTKVGDALDPCQGVVRWAGGDARREP